MKALVLLSGGLDSRLALRIVKEEGIEVEAVTFLSIFCTCTSKNSSCLEGKKAAQELKVPLRVVNVTKDLISAVENPQFGYGSGVNPCLDCRILMFKKAKEIMEEIGASFLVTGEVVGERPMSQRLEAIKLIEKEAGVEGMVLRPLSAKLLSPSIPELEGWVKRENLYSIQGRSRKAQIALARKFNLNYPCPAGGCRLTEPGFSRRARDLLKHGEWNIENIKLLLHGRHFRLSDKTKLIVGRNEIENARLKKLSKEKDIFLEARDYPGPLGLLKGIPEEKELKEAASIVASYGKGKFQNSLSVKVMKNGSVQEIEVMPLPREKIKEKLI
jgi:tRNA U34 2-thiouridine synthase MnmA/TrmU